MERPFGGLDRLFEPRHVAVVGASSDAGKFGGRAFRYLLDTGFAGRSFAVNPKQSTVFGEPAWASLAALPLVPDLIIVSVPPDQAVEAVEQGARLGISAAVVFTSGFAETDAEGRSRQRRMADIARGSGLRLLGPNCIGLADVNRRFAGTFATMWVDGFDEPGPVSVVSQSGAMASYAYVLLRDRGIGLSRWCTTGNESDVDVADCIAYFAGDDRTRVIYAALEGLTDGARLVRALELARASGKPVVMLKVGKSAIGAAASLSHTGALAGEDRVFDAAVRQAGAIRCRSFDDSIDCVAALAVDASPRGSRIGIVSASGGAGILMADRAEELGLEVPQLSAPLRAELDRIAPTGASRNPVDVTAAVLVDHRLMIEPLERVARSGEVDAVVAFLTSAFRSDDALEKVCRELQARGLDRAGTPIFLSLFTSPENLRRLQRLGFPATVDPVRCIEVLAALHRAQVSGSAAAFGTRSERAPEGDDRADVSAQASGPVILPTENDEAALLGFLSHFGLRCAPTVVTRSAEQAAGAARRMGFPVAMKIAVEGLAHKSDVGGVVLDVADAQQAARVFDELEAIAHRVVGGDGSICSGPRGGRSPAVVVQKMVGGGVCEAIVGFRRDPQFGPVVMVGLGGKWVEILDDVAMRTAPLSLVQARRMIGELRGVRILQGARGGESADIEALARAIRVLADVALHHEEIDSLEINPLLLMREGEGAWAVDAKWVLRTDMAAPPVGPGGG